MKLDLDTIFALISADKSDKDDIRNMQDHEQLGFFIRMNGFKTTYVRGSYKDQMENVWLVSGSPNTIGWSLFDLMKSMAQTYNQDSFILCDGTGCARSFDGKGKQLETFTRVTSALPSDVSYTTMPDGTRLTLRS